jgi:hypothetical protein
MAASVVTSKLPRETSPYGLDVSLTKRDIDGGYGRGKRDEDTPEKGITN